MGVPVWKKFEREADEDESSITDEVSTGWQHELICLDRALADPEVFEDPDEFKIDRPNLEKCCMAWAAVEPTTSGIEDPDQHSCPGRELSIALVTAFVQAYFETGPWQVADEDIKLNY